MIRCHPLQWPQVLSRAYPQSDRKDREELGGPLYAALMQAPTGDTQRRVAHYLAQIGHETGQLRFRREIWGPTPAQRRYEGRKDLGNTHRGDGKRFMGRGLIQITGRANYAAYGQSVGRDLLADPDAVRREPALCIGCSLWYWRTHGLDALADRDDLEAVTRAINGGLNGLGDRAALLHQATGALIWAENCQAQRLLILHGYLLTIDGDIGPKTAQALRAFQARRGMEATGRLSPAVWIELEGSKP